MYKKDGDSLLLSKILEYVILIVMIYVAFMMGEHYMEFLKGLISDSGIQTLIGVFLVTVMGITKLILDNNDSKKKLNTLFTIIFILLFDLIS